MYPDILHSYRSLLVLGQRARRMLTTSWNLYRIPQVLDDISKHPAGETACNDATRWAKRHRLIEVTVISSSVTGMMVDLLKLAFESTTWE